MQDGQFQPEKPNTEDRKDAKVEQQEIMPLEERLEKSMRFDARAEYNLELKGRLLRDLRQQTRQQQKVAFGFSLPRLRAIGGAFASATLALVIGIIVVTGINIFSTSNSIKPSIYAEQSPNPSVVAVVEVAQSVPTTRGVALIVQSQTEIFDVESTLMYAKLKRDNQVHSENPKDTSRLLPSPH